MSRIQRIEGFRVHSTIDPPRAFSYGIQTDSEQIVLRITDSDGAVGYGECTPIPGARGMLEALGQGLVGRDPFERDRLTARMRSWFASPFAISAFSIALDDLVARRLGVPIHVLYGGPWRTTVVPYAASYGSVPGRELESWVEEAEALHGRGFTAMKLRLGVEPAEAEADNVAELRTMISDELDLLGDGNGGFNPTTARAMGQVLGELGFIWFEEPLPMEGHVGYPELAADLDIPLAGGELLQTRPDTLRFLQRRSVDIVQPDPVICGGIGEVLFTAALARLHGVLCVPHTSGGQIGVAAALQALAAMPDQTLSDRNTTLYLEYPALRHEAQATIVPAGLEPVDGVIAVPDGPGLGIEIDGAALERIAVERFTIA
jgi:D-galactarolactone cycloisomerase